MVIEIKNLQKVYSVREKSAGLGAAFKRLFSSQKREFVAVDNVSLSVSEGEVLAFIGPNGAGKSTTIKILTGILTRTSGDVSVLGMDPGKERSKLAFHIGSVFGQKAQLWFHLPPVDSYELFSKLYELDTQAYKSRLNYLVEAFDIGRFLKTPVRKLSLGERMKCEVVGSLLHKPKIIFLDEPTIGLDVVAKQQIRSVIRKLNEEEKVTIFLTSHDAGDIEALAHRTVVINHGQVVYDGETEAFKRKFITSKTVELIVEGGGEAFSFNEGQIVERDDFRIKIEVPLVGGVLEKLLQHAISTLKLVDINIFEPPMEEIISGIYKATKQGKVSYAK